MGQAKKDQRTGDPLKEAILMPDTWSKLRDLKDYTLHLGELYCKLPGGALALCISVTEGQIQLQQIHFESCESMNTVSLYQRLQRAGYYWLEMKSQADTC